MKRILSAVLAILLVAILPVTASAAGKMVSTTETCFVTSKYGTYAYVYARFENTGDKAAEYSSGLFELYDANGGTLGSKDSLTAYGSVLQPGEYTYVSAMLSLDSVNPNDADDYMLSVTPKSAGTHTTLRLPCTSNWMPDYAVSDYRTVDRMTAAFTNTTEEDLYEVHVVLALLDDNDKVLYLTRVNVGYDVGITPGSSYVVRADVSNEIKEAYTAAGYTPTHVDAYAYVDFT